MIFGWGCGIVSAMKITEIFYSLQGEGLLAGVPSVFVRVAGCPLCCRWCDTKYASSRASGKELSPAEIAALVQSHPTRFVVITGGEPMFDSELPALAQRLKDLGKHITIETAGIAYVENLQCDLMSVSPKLSNSRPADLAHAAAHEAKRLNIPVLQRLIKNYDYQLKFVVDTPADLEEIEAIIAQIGDVDREKVLLMPQAATRQQLLEKSAIVAEMCKATGFLFGQRLHIMLWDNVRGR